jgi:hypothetical protein
VSGVKDSLATRSSTLLASQRSAKRPTSSRKSGEEERIFVCAVGERMAKRVSGEVRNVDFALVELKVRILGENCSIQRTAFMLGIVKVFVFDDIITTMQQW